MSNLKMTGTQMTLAAPTWHCISLQRRPGKHTPMSKPNCSLLLMCYVSLHTGDFIHWFIDCGKCQKFHMLWNLAYVSAGKVCKKHGSIEFSGKESQEFDLHFCRSTRTAPHEECLGNVLTINTTALKCLLIEHCHSSSCSFNMNHLYAVQVTCTIYIWNPCKELSSTKSLFLCHSVFSKRNTITSWMDSTGLVCGIWKRSDFHQSSDSQKCSLVL